MQLASFLRRFQQTQSRRSNGNRRRSNLTQSQNAITEQLENRALLAAVSTDFETIDSDDFSVGTGRDTAQFAGEAFSGSAGISELHRSGASAWMVNAGGTGTIAFDNPAIDVSFYARLRSTAASGSLTVTGYDLDDEVVETSEITDAAADFQEIQFTGAVTRIEVTNATDQMASIDDFNVQTAILVDNIDDESDGDLSAGDVSLREAIETANVQAGPDTILFARGVFSGLQTITLDSALGEIAITDSLLIEGPTTNDQVRIDGDGNSRIFNIDDGTSTEIDVTIDRLSVQNGSVTGNGGAILSTEHLTLHSVGVTGSAATADGGGIFSTGTLDVFASGFSQNSAQNNGGGVFTTSTSDFSNVSFYENSAAGDGGGVYNTGTLTADDLRFSRDVAMNGGGLYNIGTATVSNSSGIFVAARTGGTGGVIYNAGEITVVGFVFSDNNRGGIFNSGTATVTNSFFSNTGGGITNEGTATVIGSTIIGDSGPSQGPGLINSGSVTVVNTTLAGESSSTGAGIRNSASATFINTTIDEVISNTGGGSVTLHNSILLKNPSGSDFDAGSSHNLILDPSISGGILHDHDGDQTTGANNIVGQDDGSGGRESIDINSVLMPYANNGGPHSTRVPAANSPAIDAGGQILDSSLYPFDQRGAGFPRVVDGNDDGVAATDIGATEAPFLGSLIVSTSTDIVDGDYSDGELSLREAVAAAATRPGEEVTFADSLTAAGPVTILLESGVFELSVPMTITGPGSDLVKIDAANTSRLFEIDSRDDIVVSISGLTLTNGHSGVGNPATGARDDGGAILTEEDLRLTDVTISNSTAVGSGGAIYAEDADLEIVQSAFTGNSSEEHGGAVYARSPSDFGITESKVSINSTTFNQNTSTLNGAGIYAISTVLSLRNSTLASNSAHGSGGGIFVDSGPGLQPSLKVQHSTIFGNSASTGGGISVRDSNVAIANSTIAGNRSTRNSAGGISVEANSFELTNSVFVGNTNAAGAPNDVSISPGPTGTVAHNIAGSGLSSTNGNIIVSDWKTVVENDGTNPILKDNGGPTHTVALIPGSPAIDAGDSTLLPLDVADLDDDGDMEETVPFDQAGNLRVFDMPLVTVDAADSLDIGALEQQVPVKILDDTFDGQVLALQVNNPDGVVEPAVPVLYNGARVGFPNRRTFQVVEAFDQVPGTNAFPLTFVDLVANTFARATYQKEDGSTGALGTTVVGTASFRTDDLTFHFVPTVTDAAVQTSTVERYTSTVTAEFDSMATITSTKTFPDPEIGATSFDVDVRFEANEDINLAQGDFTGNDRFRVLMLSSMFESVTQFDANGIRYVDSSGNTQTLILNDETPVDQHLFDQPVEIGSYFELFKTERSTWFPDSPTIRIDVNNDDSLRLGLQGFLSDSDDPNDDSLGVWLEWLDAPDTVLSGTDFELSFTATATAPGSPGISAIESEETTMVDEAGGTDTFDIVLDAQPTADVTIAVSSENEAEGTASPQSLTFTPANWDVPQTVTVTGQDDFIDDGDVTYGITLTTSSDQSAYDGISEVVSATTINDDVAGFTTNKTSTTVSEDGTVTDLFTVVLDSEPASDVVLELSADSDSEAGFTATMLTFTPADWDTPQEVTVTGINDDVDDGDQQTVITVSVDQENSDDTFDALPDQMITTITTDDDAAGFTLSQTSASVSEDGATTVETLEIVLDAEPLSDVVIDLTVGNNPSARISHATITFAPDNWNSPQQITVQGINDDVDDGDSETVVTVSINTEASDDTFDALASQDITVTTIDDDTAGFTLSKTAASVSEDGTTTVDAVAIALNSQPVSDVVIDLAVGDVPDAVISETTLTFTPEDWSTSQSFSITGINDDVDDGDDQTIITVSVNADASDDAFDSLDSQTITVTTLEDDQDPPPVATISPDQITTNANPIEFSIAFSEAVTGLDLQEILVSNGVARRLSSDDSINFGVTVVPDGLGEVTITIPAGAAFDSANGENEAASATITSSFDANAEAPALEPVAVESNEMRPTISWVPDTEAVSYEIWVGQVFPTNKRLFADQSIVTTASFTPPQDFDPAFYRIWIRSIMDNDVAGPWSVPEVFDIRPQVIGPVGPSFDPRPTFSWSTIPNASGYELYIRTADPTIGDIVINDIPAEQTTYTPVADLPDGEIRWWVRTNDALFNRGWSDPAVTNVDGRTTVLSAATSLLWQGSRGAGRYILHVENLDNNEVIIREEDLAGTTFTPQNALTTGNYRAWVKAIDEATDEFATGFWSHSFDFTVASTPEPEARDDQHADGIAVAIQMPVTTEIPVAATEVLPPHENVSQAERAEKAGRSTAVLTRIDEDLSSIDQVLTEAGTFLDRFEDEFPVVKHVSRFADKT